MPDICNRCQRPGHCCAGFVLNDGDFAQWKSSTDARRAMLQNPQYDVNGDIVSVEFEPLYRDPRGRWHWWCKALSRDGRCTIYHRRPKLCQDYQPLGDNLCWHHDSETISLVDLAKEKGTFIDLFATDPSERGIPKT